MNLLKDKVMIVTGATSGIGAETAVEMAQQGASVVLAGRRVEKGEAVVDRIKSTGGTALFVQTDVTKESDIKNLVEQTVKHYGRLDGAFNNAGTNRQAYLLADTPTELFESLYDVNLRSFFLCMKYEILEMKKSGGGAIVNTSSIVGIVTASGYASYVACKHGVEGLTKTAAIDYAKDNIRVNTVLPGPIETELWDYIDPTLLDVFGNLTPMGRYAAPSEVAKPVVFLLSDWASYITGTHLVIDGGYTTV